GLMPRHELLRAVGDVEGLLCMLVDSIDAELIAAAPKLRAISQMAVGVDNIDLEAATAAGIPVGHTPGVLTETTADTAFALLAAATRRLPEGRDDLMAGRVGEWDPDYLLGGDLWGTTLGIVGMGRIGRAIARRATLGFDMRVLYTSRGPKELPFPAEKVSLPELLARADHVVLAAALTPRHPPHDRRRRPGADAGRRHPRQHRPGRAHRPRRPHRRGAPGEAADRPGRDRAGASACRSPVAAPAQRPRRAAPRVCQRVDAPGDGPEGDRKPDRKRVG